MPGAEPKGYSVYPDSSNKFKVSFKEVYIPESLITFSCKLRLRVQNVNVVHRGFPIPPKMVRNLEI